MSVFNRYRLSGFYRFPPLRPGNDPGDAARAVSTPRGPGTAGTAPENGYGRRSAGTGPAVDVAVAEIGKERRAVDVQTGVGLGKGWLGWIASKKNSPVVGMTKSSRRQESFIEHRLAWLDS